MKLDQLLEQKQMDMANAGTKLAEQNENVCNNEEEKSHMIAIDENNSSLISDDDKNNFGSLSTVSLLHGNGGESNEHGNSNEMRQMNIISAFLKANPLPTFFNTSSSIPNKKPLATKLDTGNSPENLSPTNFSQSSSNSSSSAIVPFSQDLISQGLLAVGGCRQCSKTFIDHLSLIQHFVDHFPNIFYCFEERITSQQTKILQTPTLQQNKSTVSLPIESKIGHHQGSSGNTGQNQSHDFLGQFAGLLALVNGQNMLPSSSIPVPISSTQFHIPSNSSISINNPLFNHLNKSPNRPQPSNKHQNSKANEAPVNVDKKNNHAKMTVGKKRQNDAKEFNQIAKKANNGFSARIDNKMPALSELPYHMCPHCCLTFAETTAFKTHLAMHESELSLNSDNNNSPPTMVPFSGHSSSSYSSHQFQPQQLLMKCPLCDLKFNAFRLNEHMRLHSSAHSCEICQKTFLTAFDLNLHMGTHTGYTYDCKDCGKCFPCRKSLAEHNRSHRMILSGSGVSDPSQAESTMVPFLLDGMGKAMMEKEQEQEKMKMIFPDAFDQQQIVDQNNRDRRKIRALRKGEKSRRNATLVAMESTPPPAAVPSDAIVPPTSQLQFWPSTMIKSENFGDNDVASQNNPTDNGVIGLPIMEELLRTLSNPILMEQQQQKNELNCDKTIVRNIEGTSNDEKIN